MANEVKFTTDELGKISGLQQAYQNIQGGFGQLKVQKLLLEQQTNQLEEAEVNLESEYTKAQQNERDFVKSLNDKYGPGTLNPTTGVFTPVPTETPTATATATATATETTPEKATGAPK